MKIVNMPIQVPNGDFCWDPNTLEICGHLDVVAGAKCSLGFNPKFDCTSTDADVEKPPECAMLKEVKPHEA